MKSTTPRTAAGRTPALVRPAAWPTAPEEGRLQVGDVLPAVDGGRRPVRSVPGEPFEVSATVFREGQGVMAAHVLLLPLNGVGEQRIPMTEKVTEKEPESDRFTATVAAGHEGDWVYRVEAWTDPVATWRDVARAKVPAGVDLDLVFAEGAQLLQRVRAEAEEPLRRRELELLRAAEAVLSDPARPPGVRLAAVLTTPVSAVLAAHPLRELLTAAQDLPLRVDRERALYGAWYEFFPRSEGAVEAGPGSPQAVSGTFRTAAARLAGVAAMGFDVVYLPPIHPIGRSGRKGPGNTTTARDGDPGSPWAIGAAEGGHDAVHPDLGTLQDFDHFVATAHDHGLEVALDFALQCSPDHPWVREHPEWFRQQLDGTIAYAENPPKKYQDIYPIFFDTDPEGLLKESLRVLRHWMDHGVRIFRVDNPHTKPVFFWERLIADIHSTDPDVLFLAEAFTRPAMMLALSKVGFHQTYSYFTWRDTKPELTEYLGELAGLDGGESADYLRPNLFVNTPDILPDTLRDGSRSAFAIRAVLAALAGPSWGVYAGFELYESAAVKPGSQDYLDSEKYQLRPRDWERAEAAGDSLAPLIRTLNRVRGAHRSLRQLRNLRFHPTDNDSLLCFSKQTGTGDTRDWVLTVLNLDPDRVQEGYVHLDPESLDVVADLSAAGAGPKPGFEVYDELSGESYRWGGANYVRLDPAVQVAHLFTAGAGGQ